MLERELDAGPGHVARVCFTTRAEGDFHVDSDADGLQRRRASVAPHPWTWLRQVHGVEVVRVATPGDGASSTADAAVSTQINAVLAVQSADCAPVVVVAPAALAVVHAGWRGLMAGVIERALIELRSLSPDGDLEALIGPTIRPANYEFDPDELDSVARVVGPSVRSKTRTGAPALDLVAGVRSCLHRGGVGVVDDLGEDTANERYYSHRVRGDRERQVTAAWLECAP